MKVKGTIERSCLFLRGKKAGMRTEEEIILNAFYLSEQDTDVWESDDDEYSVARGFLNAGVNRWEGYENTLWRELLTKLSDASDGDKTIDSSHSYDCPTNLMRPSSWVRTKSGSVSQFWKVIKPENLAKYANSQEYYCYFSGNEKDGFTLNFNPQVTLPTGHNIEYEYYKKAEVTDDPADEVELSDPYFLSYFIAAHLGEDGINTDFFTIAESRLEQMRVKNMSGLIGIEDGIELPSEQDFGFGT